MCTSSDMDIFCWFENGPHYNWKCSYFFALGVLGSEDVVDIIYVYGGFQPRRDGSVSIWSCIPGFSTALKSLAMIPFECTVFLFAYVELTHRSSLPSYFNYYFRSQQTLSSVARLSRHAIFVRWDTIAVWMDGLLPPRLRISRYRSRSGLQAIQFVLCDLLFSLH